MSITISPSDPLPQNTDSGLGIIMASKVKDQQKIEGQMAVNLIKSANMDTVAMPPVGNSGHSINIKV